MLTPTTAAGVATADDWDALLHAARDGDDDALGVICDAFRDYLLLTAESGLGSGMNTKVGASDIVQDTMLEACRDFRVFRGTTETDFRAWLKKLVVNNVVDSTRRYRRSQCRSLSREERIDDSSCAYNLTSADKSPSSLVRRRERDDELEQAVRVLPENRRRVLELRHGEGKSYAEIATELGVSEPAAR